MNIINTLMEKKVADKFPLLYVCIAGAVLLIAIIVVVLIVVLKKKRGSKPTPLNHMSEFSTGSTPTSIESSYTPTVRLKVGESPAGRTMPVTPSAPPVNAGFDALANADAVVEMPRPQAPVPQVQDIVREVAYPSAPAPSPVIAVSDGFDEEEDAGKTILEGMDTPRRPQPAPRPQPVQRPVQPACPQPARRPVGPIMETVVEPINASTVRANRGLPVTLEMINQEGGRESIPVDIERAFFIGHGEYTDGRGMRRPCDLIIKRDPRVSSGHLRISRQSDGLYICDLNSTNGTTLNGRHLEPMADTPLRNEDLVAFGDTKMYVRF